MKKIAVYGKGGIGKSTTISNVAAVMAGHGLTVMQIGCDPKADSTVLLRRGKEVETILNLTRDKGKNMTLEEMVTPGFRGVLCVEAGGPPPGLGCAGRGIIAALEMLREKGAYDSMPMRSGYADQVFVLTSGENMSIYAAANIAMALENFKKRGYAKLGGLILNRRNVKEEDRKVNELAEEIHTKVVASLSRSELVAEAEDLGMTVVEAFPDSPMAEEYERLAEEMEKICGIDRR